MDVCSASPPHSAWLSIDLDQMTRNLLILRDLAAPARLALAVKANGYGHGLIEISRCAERCGVETLCVAHWQEAIALREAGVLCPILLLGAVLAEHMEALCLAQIQISVSSPHKAALLQETCERIGHIAQVHLEIDTGMRRTGMRPETALTLLQTWSAFPRLLPVGIYTHFATADIPDHPATDQQWHVFQQLFASSEVRSRSLIRHCANSAAMLTRPETHLDMVRVGLAAYGVSPVAGRLPPGIEPCLALHARVTFTKTVRSGEGVSYGHRFVAPHDTRVVTVPVGYGDGVPRQLSHGGCVLIRGRRFPIVGTICMDQLMVDVGEEDIQVGEEVVLLGKQGSASIEAQELADLSGTIAWDILCRWGMRLPRVSISSEEATKTKKTAVRSSLLCHDRM